MAWEATARLHGPDPQNSEDRVCGLWAEIKAVLSRAVLTMRGKVNAGAWRCIRASFQQRRCSRPRSRRHR